MVGTIAGALPMQHNVDPNGSLTINVPLLFPHAKAMPEMSLAYHSASSSPSPVGLGWVLKGAPIIERAPATVAQDGFRGTVNYDGNDRFALDGQRIVKISTNEYRFEVEQWSKIVAHGTDPSNPDSWTQYLPDGSTRTFGATSDSNIQALGINVTRVWAVSESSDPFSNYITFSYNNDITNGAFYLTGIAYGGNKTLGMAHQRQISFGYEDREDKTTRYLGGYKIYNNKRMATITSFFQSNFIHEYSLKYNTSPLTKVSRLLSITLTDAAGSSVLPLSFNWIDANEAVFDDMNSLGTISTGVSSAQIIPLDVNATGRNDIVLACEQYDEDLGTNTLFLSVYLTDSKGTISVDAAPGSGSTGLQYPTQLLPLDMNGDGRTDLVHICPSPIDGTYSITVFTSTVDGYKKQDTLIFTPESMVGSFCSGDFEGNGYIGLIYVYQIIDDSDGAYQLRFVQFTSDGVQFSPLDACNGPRNQVAKNTHIIVGDLNGNGAEDVFLISPVMHESDSTQYCAINFFESIKGRLSFRSDGPLLPCGSNILFKSSSHFLPFSADGDGKTSLLAVSRDINGYLELQLLRSTGKTLLADPQPTFTSILYSGDLAVNKVSSTNTVNLIHSFNGISGTQLGVLRFDGEKFYTVNGVAQPNNASTGATVRWADLRGVGRVDCLLGTFDVLSGDLSIHAMPCSLSQPVDYISSFDNGIGASTSVTYAPLSNTDTYSTSGHASQYPVAFMNAMSRNVASSITLTASSSQNIAHSRTELVHYPSFVVQHLSTCSQASCPDVTADATFTYANARVSFDGRGWLGFESISKLSEPVGLAHTTMYFQQFPLLGQISGTATSDLVSSQLLQVDNYPWTFTAINSNTNYAVRLPSLKQTFYEAGTYAYDVFVSMKYDDFSNLTVKTITSSQPGVSPLSIESTFNNDTQLWVIGSKLSEAVKANNVLLRQSNHTYLPGTRISKETSMWIADSQWSTRSFKFDKAGNEISAKGPKYAYQTFAYDSTYSNLVSVTTYSTDKDSLTETASYDLALGKPLVVTNPNGLIRSYKYDVLGRIIEISEGENLSNMTTIESHNFQYTINDGFSHTRLVLSGRDKDDSGWCKMVAYTDGMYRIWKTEQSMADDLDSFVYSNTQHDGAGRVVAVSRNYLAGSQPVFTTYTYDSRSRLVQTTQPPDAAGLRSVTTTYAYTTDSCLTSVTETRSDGVSGDLVTVKTLSYLPNPDPSTGKVVLPYLTRQTDALGQTIQTQFDGLARPISITDPSGVHVAMAWDGLSRQTARCIFNGAGDNANLISHFTATFDDADLQVLVKNELTGSTKATKYDYINRAISQATEDETVSFLYDVGGKFSKGQLVKSTSSKGIEQVYDYDIRGHLIKSSLSIDDQTFLSTFKWTPAGQLWKTTNPDGSTLTRCFFPDGQTVQEITLADRAGSTQALVTFSNCDNAFSRPLTYSFGNGITSQSTLNSNGSPFHQTLTNSTNATLLQQKWKIESLGKIQGYMISGSSIQATNKAFQYDPAGQLQSYSDDNLNANSYSVSYDQSGNITSKGGDDFINDGWQLDTIQDQSGNTKYSFTYSMDGNITAKLDSSGKVVHSMTYDGEGRLAKLDGTAFVYDFGGRMIKATKSDGTVTYYPSPSYEVSITAEGETCLTSYLTHGYRRAAFFSFSTSNDKVDSTAVYYFHSDHLGSTIAVSDKSGEIITSYDYDSFGAVIVDGPDVARYKFSGKEKFGDFYYFGARFYDPESGRFLTLDNFPVNPENLAPFTLNMYTFSRNDPINFIDANGYAPLWHWLLDAVLTVGGVAICFVPLPGMAFLGGAVLGAGISGFMYDGTTQIFNHGATKDSDYLIQLGLGAVLGLASAGAGALLDWALPAGSIVEAAASRGVAGFLNKTVIAKIAGRAIIRMGVNSVAGGALGAAQQGITNLIDNEPLTTDLWQSAWLGAASGAVFGAIFEAKDVFILKPSARLKFWTGKKWDVFHRSIIEFRPENGGFVRIHPDYPDEAILTSYNPLPNDLTQPLLPSPSNPTALVAASGDSAGFSGSISIAGSSGVGPSRRFLPVYEVTSL